MGEPPQSQKWQSNRQFSGRGRGASQAVSRPSANPNVSYSAQERREKPGRGVGRPNAKPSGMNDPYGIDIASLNIQIVQT